MDSYRPSPASYFVLSLFALEVIGLVTIGALRSRALAGPLYEADEPWCFSGTPALINLLVLQQRKFLYGTSSDRYARGIGVWFGATPIPSVGKDLWSGRRDRPYRSSYSPAIPYSSISRRFEGSANTSHKLV